MIWPPPSTFWGFPSFTDASNARLSCLRNAQLVLDAGDESKDELAALQSATVTLANVSVPYQDLENVETEMKKARALLPDWVRSEEAEAIRQAKRDANEARWTSICIMSCGFIFLIAMTIHLFATGPEEDDAFLATLAFGIALCGAALYICKTNRLKRLGNEYENKWTDLKAQTETELRKLSATRHLMLEVRRVAVEAKLAQLLEDNKRLMAVSARVGGPVVHAEPVVVAEEFEVMEKV